MLAKFELYHLNGSTLSSWSLLKNENILVLLSYEFLVFDFQNFLIDRGLQIKICLSDKEGKREEFFLKEINFLKFLQKNLSFLECNFLS